MIRAAINRCTHVGVFSSARRHRRRRGATAVEMALVTPFILLIVFSSIEFSRIVMVKQALTNAAREGCRTATLATTQDSADVDQTIRQYLKGCLADYDDQDMVTVTVNPTSMQECSSGTEITTRIEVRFSDVSWIPTQWAGDAVLVGTATMKRE